MAKKILKRLLPRPEKMLDNPHLKIFGAFLSDPNLWHLNRHSVATAFSIGLFVSYIPLPGHMLTAALLSIAFRSNLPLSVIMVWFSNPFTIPPMYYCAYRVGIAVLHRVPEPFHFEPTLQWLISQIDHIGLPLLIGSFICGGILALIGNLSIRFVWRYSVSYAWKKRKGRKNVKTRYSH